ncbi:MAG TPA: o-succinylbenzoate synthase [Bacteroidetes bacterium]|nr:o-succinylbenzoate synthase [Bacteroidota bacterium]
MINLKTFKKNLVFKFPAGTSRGILKVKPSWYFILKDTNLPTKEFVGECGLLPNLSIDDRQGYEIFLNKITERINDSQNLDSIDDLTGWPSIRFGLEMLKLDYHSGNRILFSTPFTEGKYSIPINGLIWMGEKKFMYNQIKNKLEEGWKCIKIKIGAINFNEELSLLKYIRNQFSASDIEIRVDANGAFNFNNALEKLKRLSEFDLHSIEQPIKQGQIEEMSRLCEITPLPIALDEELIGINKIEDKYNLLNTIKPQFIILKPSLTGGIEASQEWIDVAKKLKIGYWVTSALESNIGLNAIAQWAATLDKDIIHGLGTGQIYTNNIDSPLEVNKGYLLYNPNSKWGEVY